MTITVSSGVTSTGIVLGSSGYDYLYVLSGGRTFDTRILEGGAYVSSGGSTDGDILSGYYADETIDSGAEGRNITVDSGGEEFVSGFVAGLKVSGYGNAIVEYGGAVTTVTVNSGGQLDVYGGAATSVTVSSGGEIFGSGALSDISLHAGAVIALEDSADAVSVSGTQLVISENGVVVERIGITAAST